MYDLRLLLEPAAASRAAQYRPEIATDQLQSLLELAALESSGTVTDRNSDGAFHLAIAEASGSALLHETVMTTLARNSRYPLQRMPDASASARSEHLAIATAIASGDSEAAEHAMQAHLTTSLTRFRDFQSGRGKSGKANTSEMTIGELGIEWLANQSHLKPSSLTPVEIAWRLHVEPKWGHVKVGDIRHSDVQNWITELRQGNTKPRSATTVLRAYAALAGILDLAVANRQIPSNPARGVTLPRKR